MLDQASLDDLLVPGHDGAVYDVNLVLRLLREFVLQQDGGPAQKMMRVGKLIDKYMREISPDQCLKVSKFLAVAKSLPDSARDCFDGVSRAIDIYLTCRGLCCTEGSSRQSYQVFLPWTTCGAQAWECCHSCYHQLHKYIKS